MLLARALGTTRLGLYTSGGAPVPGARGARCSRRSWRAARATSRVQYLLGEVEFCGLALGLGPGRLHPATRDRGAGRAGAGPRPAGRPPRCSTCAPARARWRAPSRRGGPAGPSGPSSGPRERPSAPARTCGASGSTGASGCSRAISSGRSRAPCRRAPSISWWPTRPISPRPSCRRCPSRSATGSPGRRSTVARTASRSSAGCSPRLRSGFARGAGSSRRSARSTARRCVALVAADARYQAAASVHRDFRGCDRVLEARRR